MAKLKSPTLTIVALVLLALAAGDTISSTQSAVVLESLISQFLYSKAADGAGPKAAD